mgnify:CR=1 FL=1
MNLDRIRPSLVFVENALPSVFTTQDDDEVRIWLFYRCEERTLVSRFLAVLINEEIERKLRLERFPLRLMLERAPELWIVDTMPDGLIVQKIRARLSSLPEAYLPEPTFCA